MNSNLNQRPWYLNAVVIVSALGYFVDIYDLVIFGIVRVDSLKSILSDENEIFKASVFLINTQMAGMLFGGIVWGFITDRIGRLFVLFGSILTYSLANIANAYVNTVEWYAIWRFIAGFGLAAELGAGVTLITETLPKDKRGLGVMLMAAVGISGALVAAWASKIFDWRNAFLIGGVLGLALLTLRISVRESTLFTNLKEKAKNPILLLFKTSDRRSKFFNCLLLGLPNFFVLNVLVIFAPEVARGLGMQESLSVASAVSYAYSGLILGDLMSGYLSYQLKSRRKPIITFILLGAALTITLLITPTPSSIFYLLMCFLLGVSSGYWTLYITISAEQFGTNVRGTAANMIPNTIRASVIPMNLSIAYLKPHFGLINSVAIVGAISVSLAIWGFMKLKETYHLSLNYTES